MNHSPKKILIVGGGIAGISLAYFLQDSKKYKITLIERASTWRTIGYAIGIWANGLNILKKMNLSNEFWENSTLTKKGAIMNLKGEAVFDILASKITKSEIARTVERELLHRSITDNLLENVDIRFNTDFIDIKQEKEKVLVNFNNNKPEEFDLVVGADGMRSKVREGVFGDFIRPYGWTAHVYWASKTRGLYDDYYIATNHNKVFLNIPIGDKCVVGFGYANNLGGKIIEKGQQELLSEFISLCPEMKEVVESIDHSRNVFKDELNYVSMKKWYKGNVVLIGDAKHGRSPVSGFGTSIALEDGFVLAQILKEDKPLNNSLKIFAKSRDLALRDIDRFAKVMEKVILSRSKFIKSIMFIFPTWLAIRLLRKALAIK